MPSRIELQQISEKRLEEVKILYDNQMYDGAVYLSGYVVEIALKATICKLLDIDYPEDIAAFKTHKLDVLIKLAGLTNKLTIEQADIKFKTNWSLVTSSWSESFRYRPIGSASQNQVSEIIDALEDSRTGVLTWIKKQW